MRSGSFFIDIPSGHDNSVTGSEKGDFSGFATIITIDAATYKTSGTNKTVSLIVGVNGTLMYKYVRLYLIGQTFFCINFRTFSGENCMK